ncbi:MAG: nicotinate-nucleotide diphosphorylase (carboxylating) [Verrucomicrobia bacterium]|nr:MAG: nicotinate-nucleotide diphosphorylase (carboxylating) [Verrucomicrobiota bacterium]
MDAAEVEAAVRRALTEDVGEGDVTTLATVPEDAVAQAVMRAREPLVVAGLGFAEASFLQSKVQSPKSKAGPSEFKVQSSKSLHQDPLEVKVVRLAEDGERVAAGGALLKFSGSARVMLSAERVALNFVQRLSGVATLTAQFVEAVRGTRAKILDTRKTTPGWRRFEKYAVRCGGGQNHRIGLFDMVLIKDNHVAALKHAKPNAIAAAVTRARAAYPKLQTEVEADTLEQVEQAAEAGADMILLDNMDTAQLREAVRRVRGRARTEASGGVTLATVRAIAETGVDFISVGALTHSARAVDIGLDFENEKVSNHG